MPDLVSVANALQPGIETAFIGTYARTTEEMLPELSRVMQLAVPMEGAWSIFHHFKSAPHVRRLDRDQSIGSKGFGDVGWMTSSLDWAQGVEAGQNDIEDDRTKNLENRASDVGKSFALLPERVLFQIMKGATDPLLLPSIPNAPDGVAMFSDVDGDGNPRYGRTGGNIRSGAGVATPQAIVQDFFGNVAAFRQFMDTEGVYPLFGDNFTKQGFVLFYNVANYEVFLEAFKQSRQVAVIQNVGGTENVAGATPTNLVLESGIPVFLRPTVFLTDDDWYQFAVGTPVKPVYQLYRRGIEMHPQTRDNSDIGRRKKLLGWFWDSREGYGVNECFGCMKVNN